MRVLVPPALDIVVCNYRTPADLRRFTESVHRFPPSGKYTFSISNVSPTEADQKTANDLSYLFSPYQWRHHVFQDNVGYAKACNYAGHLGQSPYIAFFNADTVITEKDFFDECVAAMEANPDWGVLGPRQVDSKNLITHAGIFGTNDAPAHRAWHQPNSSEYGDVLEAVTVSGAAMFVRRKTWNELWKCPKFSELHPAAGGAFLPSRHYFEETYLNYHAREHGWKVVYYGPCTMIHEWHKASEPGGHADQLFGESQQLFREACDYHGICHD